MRFLIIDDNPADRELIVRKLRKEFDSAEFVTVGLPGELEAVTKRGNFDIILTD